MEYEKWSARVRRVKRDAADANSLFGQCRVVGCRNPARAGDGNGLDRRWCRVHADHLSRHGDILKRTYPRSVIDPYRKAALAWLRTGKNDPFVRNAIARVEGLYRAAGVREEAFRLAGKTPAERAKAHWARLREAQVDPRRVVASWLAVEAAIAADPAPVSRREFKQVQAAKIVHRLASGSHRVWQQPGVDFRGVPVVRTVEMHKWPQSRGRVLRHIGEQLETAVELLSERWLAARTQKQGEAAQ